ncbi:phage terminase small subunit P27 family [Staphylococcus ureilyticus]|uniref:phage terminase small subunit P27 family n=1 Tax=Staphylococcus ureilyticus TaxID=94138 RepID=UPI0034DCEE7C
MAQRKLLSQQKSRLTKEMRNKKKATEEMLEKLTPLAPNPPEWLDNTATKEWNRIYPLLQELPIASLDLMIVSTYCQAYSDYINATKRMNNSDAIIETERGTKLNQNHTIKRDALSQLNSIAPKLGLTVESRLKILEPKQESKSSASVYEMFGMDDDE